MDTKFCKLESTLNLLPFISFESVSLDLPLPHLSALFLHYRSQLLSCYEDILFRMDCFVWGTVCSVVTSVWRAVCSVSSVV